MILALQTDNPSSTIRRRPAESISRLHKCFDQRKLRFLSTAAACGVAEASPRAGKGSPRERYCD